MGQAHSGHKSQDPSCVDICKELPPELLERILHFLPARECVISCRLVCTQWRDIIDSKSFSKTKCDNEGISVPIKYHEYIDWMKIYLKKPFGRNLVRNWNAEKGFKGWKILKNGGDRMNIEADVCLGANSLPAELLNAGCRKAWVTSYQIGKMSQVIDLEREGVTASFMDIIKPHIHFSAWWAGRNDCGCYYKVKVELLSDQKEWTGSHKVLGTTSKEGRVDQWHGGPWNKVEDTFKGYREGVRKIRITQGGCDTKGWAGHYGSKFTGTNLQLVLVD